MTRLRFKDRIGIHFSLHDVTQTGCHVIDCRLKTKVPEIARKWPEKIMGTNYFHCDDGSLNPEQLILRFSDTCTVTLDSRHISWGSECLVVSKSHEEALLVHKHLAEVFGIPEASSNRERAVFRILALEDQKIIPHWIDLDQIPVLSPKHMKLAYGKGFSEWADNVAEIFKNKPSSLILLQGPPGTGKTSFLRWLISQNQSNADFYFIPITSIALLANPNLTSFWLSECRYSDKPKVLLIEDADFILMKRGADNGRWVGNLLNLTDGLMCDALKFHLICTINCPSTEIDSALLRPGRLAASWVFESLPRKCAQQFADLLERRLPDNQEHFTLAEIYNSSASVSLKAPKKIGF